MFLAYKNRKKLIFDIIYLDKKLSYFILKELKENERY